MGPNKSGKTVLTQKVVAILADPVTDGSSLIEVIADPLTGDSDVSMLDTGLESNITSLFRKRQDVDLDSEDRLIIDYEGSLDVLDAVLFKLKALKEKPTVSVVYALEVGKSYNAVQKLLEMPEIPNLFYSFNKNGLIRSVSE